MNAGDRSGAVVVLVRDDVEVVIGGLACRRADLTLVDGVARLVLTARREGWSVRLRQACPDLCRLLTLTGLDDLPGLLLEPRGEPEGFEQLGIEEVVKRGDPPP